MTNARRLNAEIADAQARASALVAVYQARAESAAATEVDKILADTAAIIIRVAEQRAELLPRAMLEEALADVDEFEEEKSKLLERVVRAAAAAGSNPETDPNVAAIQGQALAALEAKNERFLAAMDEHRLKSWRAACDELIALGRPAATLVAGPERPQ